MSDPNPSPGGRRMKTAIRPIGSPYDVANTQINTTLVSLAQDYSSFPEPPWPSLARLIGPMLPGTMMVVGARPGLGKTTLLLCWFSALFRSGRPCLYIVSGDGGAQRIRTLLIALHCDMNKTAVLRHQWDQAKRVLSSPEALDAAMAELQQQREWADVGMVWDMPELTIGHLRDALKYGLRNGAQYIFLDHISRFQPGSPMQITQELARVVEGLASTAAQKQICVIVAAAITPGNKDINTLSEFQIPSLAMLTQSQALAREPHIVLSPHRVWREDMDLKDKILQARRGSVEARSLLEPDIMGISVLKDRDGNSVGSSARLRVLPSGLLTEIT